MAKAMAKEFDKDQQKESRKALPEVLETDLEDAGHVVLLIEEAAALKKELDPKIEGSKAARYEEIKTELTMIQTSAGVEGLRHNDVVFVARLNNGRTTVDNKRFVQGLLERGVKAQVIEAATEAATKTGDPFWVKQIEEI